MTSNHDGNRVRAGRQVNWVIRILILSLGIGAVGLLALTIF